MRPRKPVEAQEAQVLQSNARSPGPWIGG
jgi:hypothetical protein